MAAKSIQLGVDSVPADQWRHFHKVTPFTRAGALWLVLLYLLYQLLDSFIQNGSLIDLIEGTRDLLNLKVVAIVLGSLLVVTLLVIAFAFMTWSKETFALVESGIHYRRGIFFKTHTHMRWDRVQSVEIQQKLFGRIFGFGTVKVESAGNDEDLELGLLRMRDAADLRREVLTVVDRVRRGLPYACTSVLGELGMAADTHTDVSSGARYEAAGGDETDAAHAGVRGHVSGAFPESGTDSSVTSFDDTVPNGVSNSCSSLHTDMPVMLDIDDLERDQLIYHLPLKRQILSSLLSFRSVIAGIVVAGLLASTIIDVVLGDADSGTGASFIGSIVIVAGALWSLIKGLFDEYGTKLFISANGLRRRAGLTKLVTTTYPPQRIHAVTISRSWLWKKLGWWKLDVLKAGIAGSNDTQELTRVFVPAATHSEMLRVLWTLLPGLGTSDDTAVLAEAFDGLGDGEWFVGSPKVARRVNPIAWRGNGVAITPHALITRGGKFGRRVSFILQDHTQSLHMKVGPIQHKLKLAHIQADLVPGLGALAAKNLDIVRASELFSLEEQAAREARSQGISESLEEWKIRVGVTAHDEPLVASEMNENLSSSTAEAEDMHR